jgi:hypothetical protein
MITSVAEPLLYTGPKEGRIVSSFINQSMLFHCTRTDLLLAYLPCKMCLCGLALRYKVSKFYRGARQSHPNRENAAACRFG